MTVSELIEQLQQYPGHREVLLCARSPRNFFDELVAVDVADVAEAQDSVTDGTLAQIPYVVISDGSDQ